MGGNCTATTTVMQTNAFRVSTAEGRSMCYTCCRVVQTTPLSFGTAVRAGCCRCAAAACAACGRVRGASWRSSRASSPPSAVPSAWGSAPAVRRGAAAQEGGAHIQDAWAMLRHAALCLARPTGPHLAEGDHDGGLERKVLLQGCTEGLGSLAGGEKGGGQGSCSRKEETVCSRTQRHLHTSRQADAPSLNHQARIAETGCTTLNHGTRLEHS